MAPQAPVAPSAAPILAPAPVLTPLEPIPVRVQRAPRWGPTSSRPTGHVCAGFGPTSSTRSRSPLRGPRTGASDAELRRVATEEDAEGAAEAAATGTAFVWETLSPAQLRVADKWELQD